MQILPLILLCGGMMILLAAASFFSKNYSLDRIKSKKVGDGQHGTARWATKKEIWQTYLHILTPSSNTRHAITLTSTGIHNHEGKGNQVFPVA